MTSLEQRLFRRHNLLKVIAGILGAVAAVALYLAFVQVGAESDRRADALSHEAELRGTAVSTLSGDVRALRLQVQAAGQSPVAPDPAAAVKNLPERTAVPVPVPIPGPKGDKGDTGPSGVPGSPAPVVTPSPGPTGPAGITGPAGPPGANGIDGKDGKDGQDGKDGANGAAGQPPAGWTWTDPAGVTYTCTPDSDFDPANPHYTCAQAAPSTPTSSPSPSGELLGVGMLSACATYRRL